MLSIEPERLTRFEYTAKQRQFFALSITLGVIDATDLVCMAVFRLGGFAEIAQEVIEAAFAQRHTNPGGEAGAVHVSAHSKLVGLYDEISAEENDLERASAK